MKKIIAIFILLCSSVCFSQNVLDQDDVILVDSLGTNKICFHRNMSLVDSSYHPQIVNKIKTGVDSVNQVIKFENVEFRVLVFPERTIPRLGMSGAAPNDKHIYILLNPYHSTFDEAINLHIIPTIAHEYHHTLRNRTVGYGKNLFEAMISEGLADHFSLEVTNQDTLAWKTTLPDSVFDFWKKEAEKMWFNTEYDHLAWFIGLNSDIPRGTAYAIGFKMVGDFLKKHPSETAASLYATPADKFLVK
jgi:uncharacterized protein YjaZ